MSPRGNPPGTNRGVHRGKGKEPTGKRMGFYLAPDLFEWWYSLPERGRSDAVNKAIREMLERKAGE